MFRFVRRLNFAAHPLRSTPFSSSSSPAPRVGGARPAADAKVRPVREADLPLSKTAQQQHPLTPSRSDPIAPHAKRETLQLRLLDGGANAGTPPATPVKKWPLWRIFLWLSPVFTFGGGAAALVTQEFALRRLYKEWLDEKARAAETTPKLERP